MKYKENRNRNGTLVGYWDEDGVGCSLSALYKTDEDGNATDELRDDVEIIPMTEEELAEVKARVAEMEAEQAATQYKQDRAREYPDFRDYLDGVVKGDQSQIDAYIAACQAVKAKYPKPE